jgi:hypothetical protein
MANTDRSALFSTRAQRAALGVLTATIARASQRAVAAVADQTEAGYLQEAAHDVAALRRDAGLVEGLAALAARARETVQDQALAALEDGFRTTAEAEAGRLGLVVTVDDADRKALAGHPIVDATAAEWSGQLADRLAWRVRSVATRAALGAIKPAAIPGQLDQAAMAWANEVGRLVGDAWHAGRTAARMAMARALSGG